MAVAAAVQAILGQIDQEHSPIEVDQISAAIQESRPKQDGVDPQTNHDTWGEVVAFALNAESTGSPPWGTYFGPFGSFAEDDEIRFAPEIREIDSAILDSWVVRSAQVSHPVLRARYSDLIWDLSRHIDGRNRNFQKAAAAIDSYLDAIEQGLTPEFYSQMASACRSVDLGCSINDQPRKIRARNVLLGLHDRAVAGEGWWWKSFDRLIYENGVELTDADRDHLVQSLEGMVEQFANTDQPELFNPHQLQGVGEHLILYYRQRGQRAEAIALNEKVARAFEHLAGLGDALVATSFLQTAESAFRDAGMAEDAKRMRIDRADAIKRSRELMQPITFTMEVPAEDLRKFVSGIVGDSPGGGFARIANAFLWRRDQLEEALKTGARRAPLQALMPMALMADDHQAAVIGGVEDDIEGRLCREGALRVQTESLFLDRALTGAVEAHDLSPHHFAGFAARAGLFDSLEFVFSGMEAWFRQDFTKVVFVLTPQIERALRQLTSNLTQPVTRPHPHVAGREISLNMGDMLSNPTVVEAIGPDMLLYFRAIYSDPRGINLRNNVAHGLVGGAEADGMICNRIVHTLLVLGAWEELTEARRRQINNSNQ